MDAASTVAALTESLRDDPRVAAAILFGSFAGGSPRPDRDVDVAVLPDAAAGRTGSDPGFLDALGRLGVATGRDVHLLDLEQIDCALRRNVFASGRLLFGRSAGRLGRLKIATLIEYADWEYGRAVVDAALDRRLQSRHG